MNDKKCIVSLQHLSKSFFGLNSPPIVVFEDFSLKFMEGQITSVLGPTGCGKTTLLNLINALLKPDSGSISFPAGVKPTIGTVMQKDLLLPWRNVRKNVLLSVEIKGTPLKEADLQMTLREVKLDRYEYLYPDELSGGMKQKVSLIRTLLFDPELVLLDEPFANIDYYQKLDLESHLVRWIREKNRASIFVTHDIEEAIAVADRLIVLSDKPATVVLDVEVDFSLASKLDPVLARKESKFSNYFEQIWKSLKDNAN